jgi:DNA-binding FadR family transcriptional regulator
MKIDSIQIASAPEALVQQIVKKIDEGELQPGICLPSQRQLAKMFNVGLGSVREAIKILNTMGYLEVIRGKGTYVSNNLQKNKTDSLQLHRVLEAVSLADLMQARELVECEVASLAAKDASPQDIERLEKITDAMEWSFRDTKLFYELDFDFHIHVAKAANNKVLLEIIKLLFDKAHGHTSFMDNALRISHPASVEKAVETARSIVKHIKTGNAKKARSEMSRHLNIVNSALKREFLGEDNPVEESEKD